MQDILIEIVFGEAHQFYSGVTVLFAVRAQNQQLPEDTQVLESLQRRQGHNYLAGASFYARQIKICRTQNLPNLTMLMLAGKKLSPFIQAVRMEVILS